MERGQQVARGSREGNGLAVQPLRARHGCQLLWLTFDYAIAAPAPRQTFGTSARQDRAAVPQNGLFNRRLPNELNDIRQSLSLQDVAAA